MNRWVHWEYFLNPLILNQDLQDFEDYSGRLRVERNGYSQRIILYTSFSPMCYTSAKSLAIKAASNNKLPTQNNDVMVNPINPENPDSNNCLLPA